MIGLVFAVLDLFDVVRLGLLTLNATNCAQIGDLICVSNGIVQLVLFIVDIIAGPILFAANFVTYPPLGIPLLGTIFFIAIIFLVYGRR